eukprot:7462877-Pyramimonas_sp.AAC.1
MPLPRGLPDRARIDGVEGPRRIAIASPMYRRCVGDASAMHPRRRRCTKATSAWGSAVSTVSRIVDASAMRRDPPTPSARTPSGRRGLPVGRSSHYASPPARLQLSRA